MSCYHPLKAFPIGVNKETGKDVLKICSYETEYLSRSFKGQKWFPVEYPPPPGREDVREDLFVSRHVDIPCGTCLGCRCDQSRRWADRIMLELKYHNPEECWFVTLTYNDFFVPKRSYCDEKTGEYLGTAYSLQIEDLQKFIKRCRKHIKDKWIDKGLKPLDYHMMYYAAGEYGSDTLRPHYHLILFSLPLPDARVVKRSRDGYLYYRSETLERLWSVLDKENGIECLDPIGNVLLARVTPETAAYCARYTSKKLGNRDAWRKIYGDCPDFRHPDDVYNKFGMEKEFSCMSLKPAIGKRYYLDHPEMVEKKYTFIATEKGSYKLPFPKAFERYLELDNPELYCYNKERRKEISKVRQEAKLKQTDLSYLEMLEIEEKSFEKKTKILKRGN